MKLKAISKTTNCSSIDGGRVVVNDFRQKYNRIRPHSRLGYKSPAVFAVRSCPSPDGQRTIVNINSNLSKD